MLKVHAERKTVTVAQDASFEGQPGCQENRLSVAFRWTDQPIFRFRNQICMNVPDVFFRIQIFSCPKPC